jgi:hypothetical protein
LCVCIYIYIDPKLWTATLKGKKYTRIILRFCSHSETWPNSGNYILILRVVFLFQANFLQISTWKVWFRPKQRIFHEWKNDWNLQIFEGFFLFKLPDFHDKFQQVAKEYRRIGVFFSTFISGMQPNLAKLFGEWFATLGTSQNPKKKPPAWE